MFNTLPANPFPPSTEQMNKGDNTELNNKVQELETSVDELKSGLINLDLYASADYKVWNSRSSISSGQSYSNIHIKLPSRQHIVVIGGFIISRFGLYAVHCTAQLVDDVFQVVESNINPVIANIYVTPSISHSGDTITVSDAQWDKFSLILFSPGTNVQPNVTSQIEVTYS